jgi:MFS family permease
VGSFGSFGMAQWIPAYFVRFYGLSLTEVGLYSGGTAVFGAVLGTVFGGYVVSRLSRRDVRWELWWSTLVFALFPLLILPSFLVVDWKLALGFQLVAFFVGASGGGVALSAAQTYVEPHRRAMAIAIILLVSSLLGLGLGPVAVGLISDLLAPHLGIESLRYALIATTVIPFWAAAHFWLAARSSRAGLAPRFGCAVPTESQGVE